MVKSEISKIKSENYLCPLYRDIRRATIPSEKSNLVFL